MKDDFKIGFSWFFYKIPWIIISICAGFMARSPFELCVLSLLFSLENYAVVIVMKPFRNVVEDASLKIEILEEETKVKLNFFTMILFQFKTFLYMSGVVMSVGWFIFNTFK